MEDYTGSSKFAQWDKAYLDILGYDSLTELMRAIVLRTVDDYHNKPLFREEAKAYMEDPEEEYLFSFKGICLHLGLCPEKTRKAIVYSKEKISTRRRAA